MARATSASACALLVIVVLLPHSSGIPLAHAPPQPVADGDKVQVALYYETLCPGCREFIAGDLSKAVSLLPSIISLTLSPWGNAKLNGTNITCQHGPDECKLNMLHTCLLNFVPAAEAMPAIKCMESSVVPSVITSALCIRKHAPGGASTWNMTRNCMSGPMGLELVLREAKSTMSLQPPHKYTPWLTINGVPAYDNYTDVARLVCEAYTGPSRPVACEVAPPPSPPRAPLAGGGVCWRGGGGGKPEPGNCTSLFKRCRATKALGEACLELLSCGGESGGVGDLAAELTFPDKGLSFEVPLGKGSECLTDADLLILLAAIPQLAPYEKQIKQLIELRGFIPAEVFSECVRLHNVTVGPAPGELSGCVALDSRVMCWKKKCLHQGTTEYGCFHRNGTRAGP